MAISAKWGNPFGEIIKQNLINESEEREARIEYLNSMTALNKTMEEFYKTKMENIAK